MTTMLKNIHEAKMLMQVINNEVTLKRNLIMKNMDMGFDNISYNLFQPRHASFNLKKYIEILTDGVNIALLNSKDDGEAFTLAGIQTYLREGLVDCVNIKDILEYAYPEQLSLMMQVKKGFDVDTLALFKDHLKASKFTPDVGTTDSNLSRKAAMPTTYIKLSVDEDIVNSVLEGIHVVSGDQGLTPIYRDEKDNSPGSIDCVIKLTKDYIKIKFHQQLKIDNFNASTILNLMYEIDPTREKLCIEDSPTIVMHDSARTCTTFTYLLMPYACSDILDKL